MSLRGMAGTLLTSSSSVRRSASLPIQNRENHAGVGGGGSGWRCVGIDGARTPNFSVFTRLDNWTASYLYSAAERRGFVLLIDADRVFARHLSCAVWAGYPRVEVLAHGVIAGGAEALPFGRSPNYFVRRSAALRRLDVSCSSPFNLRICCSTLRSTRSWSTCVKKRQ